jgi:TolB protein
MRQGFFVNVIAGRAVYKNAERPEASGWGVPLLREIIAKDVTPRGGEGKDLTIRTLYLPALIVAGVLLACATAVLAVSREVEATFPGKNGKIAYVAFRVTNGTAEIYTINPGGGDKIQLTHNNNDEFSLSYSPNGKKIVYVSGYVNEEIYTIDAFGGGKTQLTHNNKADFDPSYSPNGKKIVYVSGDGNDGELYTIDVRTGHRVQLTHNNTDDYYPSYSPNGKKIVYVSGDGDASELYTIDASGGGKTQITHNNKADYDPDYSPDGKRIVYEGSDTFGDLNVDKAESDIYTIKAGGGDKTHVTNTDNVDEFEPSYSPDGKKIVYTVYKGNASELYTIDVGGGGKTKLTNTDNVDEYMPSWGSRPYRLFLQTKPAP